MPKTQVTVLVENTATGIGLFAEHGLAYWIEREGQNVLFDTGQGGVLISNAHRLGVRPENLHTLVLSHGHYDHTGGVAEALTLTQSITIHAHPAALKPKFTPNGHCEARRIGVPSRSAQTIQDPRHRMVATLGPTEVASGLMATGPIPRLTDFEDTGGPFFLDEACQQPDPLEDDQALFFDTVEGTVVLLGCAHAGVVNTLDYIRQLTNERPIRALVGGMHLVGASPQRIERTIQQFKRLGIEQLAPAHCTGMSAVVALWNAFPGRCQPCPVGTRFTFD